MSNPDKKLTAKQQGFTDSVLDGCSLADSYRHNYNCANMSDRAIQVESSRLAAHPDVALMIAEKRQAIQEARLWTRQQALSEAEANLVMARARSNGYHVMLDSRTWIAWAN